MHAGRMFGKYELTGQLGQGGMAEVWKATLRGAAGQERTLVLKRVLPQLVRDEEFVAMFVREGQLCSMLSHENIVEVFELGVLGGEYYLAMEYVPGKDLHALMQARRKEPPPPGLAAYVGRELGRALGYAHAAKDGSGAPLRIVHRDVTPSNVMLCFDGGIKLVDFGVAKAFALSSARITSAGAVRGKLGYMSPEQIAGGEVDHRTDLFSVGVTLYEVLTGRRLFLGENDAETLEKVLSGPIYEPSRINPAVPPALDAVVMRALARDRDRRFQSGDELADALEPCVWDLAWDRSQLVSLLAERFPDADPAAEPAPARRHSLHKLPAVTGDRPSAQRDALHSRPTAVFVRAVDEMGAWTDEATERDADPPVSPPAAAAPTAAAETRPMRRPTAPRPAGHGLSYLALLVIVSLFVLAGVIYFSRR